MNQTYRSYSEYNQNDNKKFNQRWEEGGEREKYSVIYKELYDKVLIKQQKRDEWEN